MQNNPTTFYEQSQKGTETTGNNISQPSHEANKNITDLYKEDSVSSDPPIHTNSHLRTHSKMDQFHLLSSQQHQDLQHKEIRVFMKKADKLNQVSYRKLHEGKVLMPEPSVLNIYKSSKNILDDIVIPNNRDQQIRSIYLQGSKNPKRNYNSHKKANRTVSLLKRKLTTDSKLVQTDTLNEQNTQMTQELPVHKKNRTIQHPGQLQKLKKTLKAIEEDDDQQFIPVKRKNATNRMFNTISMTGDIVRNKVDTNSYLNSVAKAQHQFNASVRRYSLKQQYQQSTVFNSTQHSSFNTTQFLQPIVNQPVTNYWQNSTVQKIKSKQEQGLPIIKQKSSLQQETKKQTQSNNRQTQASRFAKGRNQSKEHIISENSMFVQNDNSVKRSQRGSQATFTMIKPNNINNTNNWQTIQKYSQPSTSKIPTKNIPPSSSPPKKVQTCIQVPQVYEIAIGTDTNNFIKTAKKIIHPINISFTESQSNWITSQYQPKSQFIRSIDTKNFNIKKYRNGVYFGQLSEDGMKNGRGVVFYFNGRSYEGNFYHDLKQGKGYQYMPDGSTYVGEFKAGLKEGKGTFQWPNGEVYDGQWVGGKKNGSGMWKSPKGDTYLGQWKNGKIEGFGVLTIKQGDRYEGQFKNSMKNGLGTQRYSNGDTYVGQFSKNRPNGQGEYYYHNGDLYRGMFSNGLKHGEGFLKTSKGEIYQGQFRNEKKCGLGQLTNGQGIVYKGNFENDLKHGYGEEFSSDGTMRSGYWINGNMVETDMGPIIEDELDRQQSIVNMKAKGKNNKAKKQQAENGLKRNTQKLRIQKRRSPLSKSPHLCQQKQLSPSDPNFNRACGCKRKH